MKTDYHKNIERERILLKVASARKLLSGCGTTLDMVGLTEEADLMKKAFDAIKDIEYKLET